MKNGGADQFRARQERITVQGCVSEGVCEVEGIIVSPPPVDRQPPPMDTECTVYTKCQNYWEDADWDGGWDGGIPPGDSDYDGDTLDEGPGAFAGCVALGIGAEGWLAIAGSAYSGYKLYQARADVRARYAEYRAYAESYTWRTDFSNAESDLLYRNYVSATEAEEAFWVALATTSGVAVAKIATAVKACAPLLAAPTT